MPGLSHLAPQVSKLIAPAIRVHARAGEVALGGSKFGGDPDLPAGVSWPRGFDVPMEFVGQVRLEDVAPHDAEHILPSRGLLLFFNNSLWASSFDDDPSECSKTLFIEDVGALVRTPPPRVEHEDEYGKRTVPRMYRSAALSFTPTVCLPDMGALLDGDELAELRSVWEKFLYEQQDALPRAGSQMLGYFAQHDDLNAMSKDDVLLFQIDSDPEADFDWGKRYFLYFVAAKADVARANFSRVRVHHDIAC